MQDNWPPITGLFLFFQLFCCPRRCTYTILGVFILYFVYSISQPFHRFYGFLPWEQGLVLGAFCHTSPAGENRDRNIGILSISSRSPGTRTNRVRNSPRQHHHLDGYRYILYTMYSRPELMLEFFLQVGIKPQPPWTCLPEAWIIGECHI